MTKTPHVVDNNMTHTWPLLLAATAPAIRHVVTRFTTQAPTSTRIATWLVLIGTALAISSHSLVTIAVLCLLAIPLTAAAFVDIATLTLPDVLIIPAGIALILIETLAAVYARDPTPLLRAFVCGMSCFVWYGIGCATGGLGFGDVKLGALLGMATGWIAWSVAMVSAIYALVIGVAWILLWPRGVDRRSTIPFGPALGLGALLAIALH